MYMGEKPGNKYTLSVWNKQHMSMGEKPGNKGTH